MSPFPGDSASPHAADSAWAALVFAGDRALGSAVLVDATRLLTCDHVAVGDDLWVEFPKSERDDERYRVVRIERAPRYDLALLTLDGPCGVAPAPVRHPPPAGLVDRAWWTFGYPDGEAHGNDARGVVGIDLGRGFVRLDARPDSRSTLRRGFSGSGLWSPEYQAVVGVVVEANPAGDGKAVTFHKAISCFPDAKLDRLAAWTAGDADEVARTSWGITRRPVSGWNLSDDPETARHWSPRARGVTVDSERGHRFEGRDAALTEIVGWLDAARPDRRVLVVTGSPGVGKSAVLGRIVTTADSVLRAELPADDKGVRATPGTVQCAVHAKGKTALEVAAEIARAASAPLPERPDDLAPAVRAELTERPRPFAIVVDALDEASTPVDARRVVGDIVLPLAQTCADVGVRLVVGTRRHDDIGDLLETFGAARALIDLDLPEYFELRDLTAYALATLQLKGSERPGNPYDDIDIAKPVAERIAERSDRNFLVAGLVAKSHGLYDTDPVDPNVLSFVGTVDNALHAFLARVPPVRGVPAADLLTVLALAYAQAPGLPADLWRIAVNALTDVPFTDRDLRAFARSSAANFLVETAHGQSYRLFHQALDDVLLEARAKLTPRAEDERAIATAFLAHGRATGWDDAPAYLLRSLSAHAAPAGMLDALLVDTGYILHADMPRLLADKHLARTHAGRTRVRLLDLTPQARRADPAERLAMLALTEKMEGIEGTFNALTGTADVPYRPIWATTRHRQEVTRFEGHTGPVRSLCALALPDGTVVLASAAADDTVRVWDPTTGSTRHVLNVGINWVRVMCAVPLPTGGTLLATAGELSGIRVWDPVTGTETYRVRGYAGLVNGLCALNDRDGTPLLVSGSTDGKLRIWDPVTGQLLRRFDGFRGALCTVPGDGPLLASGSADGSIRVWDPITGVTHRLLDDFGEPGKAMCALPGADGRVVLAISVGAHSVYLCDLQDGTTRPLGSHYAMGRAMCALPEPGGDARLAIIGDERVVRIRQVHGGSGYRVFEGHTDWVRAVCAFPVPGGGTLMATGGDDHTVRIWDYAGGDMSSGTREAVGSANALCSFTDLDGRALLAAAGSDGKVEIVDESNGASVLSYRPHNRSVNAVCVLPVPDGVYLATVGNDGTVRISDPCTGQHRHLRNEHERSVNAVCMLAIPGGRTLLVTGSNDCKARIWDLRTGRVRHDLSGHTNGVRAVCAVPFPGQDVLLATAGDDWTVRLWDPRTASPRAVLEGHTGGINALAVVPDAGGGVLLASASNDRTVRLWDPETWTVRQVLEGHTDWVNAVCVLPRRDGRVRLATASNDRTVRVWDLRSASSLTIPVHHTAHAVASVTSGLAVGMDAGIALIRLDERNVT
ncbi:WD domain, G-beta repeat [Actinomadura rubteroloni]|uniref:WD domain, G-beta repeat n=1 Tax=Actinomadura rubteroloni TaxID=1926885 RepID=A0A2P4UCK6_9ACTN|nr:trypsin-like peptidase domain-containing protein [Actinomadura rubteroloni]POM22762.1 WD domain, G-beta repeat [Actinomadura rubteroloni]